MSFFQLPSFLRKKQTIEHALKELIGSFEEETQLKKAVELVDANVEPVN